VTVQVAGQAGFLLIINGFVKFTADNASGIPMTTSAPVSEIDAEVSDFKPLTAEEAQRLREKNPEMSPWWVIGAQVAMGLLVAGVAWMWTQRPGVAVSAFYGAMAVAIPAALFVRGVRRARGAVSQSAVMLRFFVWELIKIALTVALLAAAPWLIEGISWLALLAGVVVAMKMYWVALLVRPGLLNRI
jgi:ATP synthase protein I